MLTHPTVRIIRDEHGVLSAVLRSIGLLLAESRRRGVSVDFQALRAMLFYIDEFPEKVHHPKESTLLFPLLRLRTAEGADVLNRLDRDHGESQRMVRDLEHEALALEMMSDAPDVADRRERFEAAAHAYIAAYLEHIRIEETEVLPLAERVLTAGDWGELDRQFMLNRDPLTCRDGNDAYHPLFKRILMALPAPLGLGSALQAMSGVASTSVAHEAVLAGERLPRQSFLTTNVRVMPIKTGSVVGPRRLFRDVAATPALSRDRSACTPR